MSNNILPSILVYVLEDAAYAVLGILKRAKLLCLYINDSYDAKNTFLCNFWVKKDTALNPQKLTVFEIFHI